MFPDRINATAAIATLVAIRPREISTVRTPITNPEEIIGQSQLVIAACSVGGAEDHQRNLSDQHRGQGGIAHPVPPAVKPPQERLVWMDLPDCRNGIDFQQDAGTAAHRRTRERRLRRSGKQRRARVAQEMSVRRRVVIGRRVVIIAGCRIGGGSGSADRRARHGSGGDRPAVIRTDGSQEPP